jgi:hypothetical protein
MESLIEEFQNEMIRHFEQTVQVSVIGPNEAAKTKFSRIFMENCDTNLIQSDLSKFFPNSSCDEKHMRISVHSWSEPSEQLFTEVMEQKADVIIFVDDTYELSVDALSAWSDAFRADGKPSRPYVFTFLGTREEGDVTVLHCEAGVDVPDDLWTIVEIPAVQVFCCAKSEEFADLHRKLHTIGMGCRSVRER